MALPLNELKVVTILKQISLEQVYIPVLYSSTGIEIGVLIDTNSKSYQWSPILIFDME